MTQPNRTTTITTLLERWRAGDEDAGEVVVERTYAELRHLALAAMRRERSAHTLGATGLVHEVYLRLAAQGQPDWEGRRHFLLIAGRLMRQVLIDHARALRRQKRGGDLARITLGAGLGLAPGKPPDVLELEEALKDLERIHPELAAVVELHCFGGLTFEETAEALELSSATVGRRWRRAKAWLYRILAADR